MEGPSETQLLLRRQTMLHTTSYLNMKADTARTFLMAIITMVISVIPTWRTQHEAYIQARLKLVTPLDEETCASRIQYCETKGAASRQE